MNYLTVEQILYVHDMMIERFGGRHGLNSLAELEACLARPRPGVQDRKFFTTEFEKAATLLHSIIHTHPFVDGNKWTAFGSAGLFLELNGIQLLLTSDEAVSMTL